MCQSYRFTLIAIALMICLSAAMTTAVFGALADGSPNVLTFTDETGGILRTKTFPDPYIVRLRNQQVDLRQYAVKSSELISGRPVPLIVSFVGIPSSAQRYSLESAGAQVIGPLPPAGFLIRADADSVAIIANFDDVVVIARFVDSWKINERLPPGPVPAAVEIVIFEGVDPEPVVAEVAQRGQVQWVSQVLNRTIVGAVLAADAWVHITALSEVEMIDVAGVGAMMNNEVRVVMQTEKAHYLANQAFYYPIYNIGVWGQGQIVTLADTGLEAHEVYARPGKILANYPAPNTCVTSIGDSVNHGTGVAATLLGDKIGMSGFFNTANDYDGLALRADMVMQDIVNAAGTFCPPNDYVQDLFFPAWQGGSMVHSNSWGHWALINYPQGTYSWRSQLIDEYMSIAAFREQVIVYAAGNAGATWGHPSLPDGTYVPFSLSDEAHSKNAIIVGGSGNGAARNYMYRYSSRGPTDDCLGSSCTGIQRVKPDLLAPADYYVDTADTGGYSAYSIFPGTSVSTPAVAAAAAMVRDYFAQGIYPVKPNDPPLGGPPSAALIKAMLVNATVPIYHPTGFEGNAAQGLSASAYPNYDQGYGRPVLDNVLEPAGYRKLKVYENATTTANTGDVWQRSVKFKEKWGATCNYLRVTLSWSDPKATLAAGPKLVNDLDLEVYFLGKTYKGNYLLTGNTVYDTTNNVEDVFVPLGRKDLFSKLLPVIRVYGSSVPSGPQPFAVVVTYGACADNIPCPPPRHVGGCYRGPGDVVPGSTWTSVPGCGEQYYWISEYNGKGRAYPFCKVPRVRPFPINLIEP